MQQPKRVAFYSIFQRSTGCWTAQGSCGLTLKTIKLTLNTCSEAQTLPQATGYYCPQRHSVQQCGRKEGSDGGKERGKKGGTKVEKEGGMEGGRMTRRVSWVPEKR